MAPKTLIPEQEADAAVGPQSPAERVQLAGVSLDGADYGATAVTKAVLYLADGRRLVLDLPVPPAPDDLPERDWAGTKAGRKILEVLGRDGRPMKGTVIASLAGYKYTSGSFRSVLAGLVTQGLLHKDDDDDGYTLTE